MHASAASASASGARGSILHGLRGSFTVKLLLIFMMGCVKMRMRLPHLTEDPVVEDSHIRLDAIPLLPVRKRPRAQHRHPHVLRVPARAGNNRDHQLVPETGDKDVMPGT